MFLPLECRADRTQVPLNPLTKLTFRNMALPFRIKKRNALAQILPLGNVYSVATSSELFEVDAEFSKAALASQKSVSILIAPRFYPLGLLANSGSPLGNIDMLADSHDGVLWNRNRVGWGRHKLPLLSNEHGAGYDFREGGSFLNDVGIIIILFGFAGHKFQKSRRVQALAIELHRHGEDGEREGEMDCHASHRTEVEFAAWRDRSVVVIMPIIMAEELVSFFDCMKSPAIVT